MPHRALELLRMVSMILSDDGSGRLLGAVDKRASDAHGVCIW